MFWIQLSTFVLFNLLILRHLHALLAHPHHPPVTTRGRRNFARN